MALKQNDLNWFRPLWRRVAVALFLAAWLAWELLWSKDMFWALLVGAALAYSAGGLVEKMETALTRDDQRYLKAREESDSFAGYQTAM